MPSEHARLSPSAAERWIACPASVRMTAEVPQQQSSGYAQEGTIAHSLAELKASREFGMLTPPEYVAAVALWAIGATQMGITDEQIEEMHTHTDTYVRLLRKLVDELPGSRVLLEQRVYPVVPNCFGTVDAVIVSAYVIVVVDFKYGMGVEVSPVENPQLKLYGLGALEGYGDVLANTERVNMVICQPRVPGHDAWEYSMSANALREWRRAKVLPMAEQALSDTAPFFPGEVQCRWCPAAGICRPRMEASCREDFSSDPDIIDDEELGELLTRIPAIRDWCAAVETTVMRKVYEQEHSVPGWKAVLSGGRRKITNDAKAVDLLLRAGYDPERVSRLQTETLAKLEKVVGGREALENILGDALVKSEGKPGLAPDSDPRPAVSKTNQLHKDFQGEA